MSPVRPCQVEEKDPEQKRMRPRQGPQPGKGASSAVRWLLAIICQSFALF